MGIFGTARRVRLSYLILSYLTISLARWRHEQSHYRASVNLPLLPKWSTRIAFVLLRATGDGDGEEERGQVAIELHQPFASHGGEPDRPSASGFESAQKTREKRSLAAKSSQQSTA